MTAFNWNDVITMVASIVDPDLSSRGIAIDPIQPYLGQNCILPRMFPSRNPSITVQNVTRLTFGRAVNNGKQHKGQTVYTLDWIYLHIEYTQQLNRREYEAPIRDNLAAIFRAIVRRDRDLGIGRVLPASAEVDYDLQDPTSGKQFLGAHVTLVCNEIFEL